MSIKQMSPVPTSTLDVAPSNDEIEFFQENGYLVVERITTDEELAWLAELYDHIFDPANAGEPGAPVNRSDKTAPGVTQAFLPEINYPELLTTTYHRNARRYAAALLGADDDQVSSWSHMIRKMPGGREAPWHQDEAYWEPELAYHALGVWLPLHDVTEEMGAMQFIPGSHRSGVYDHVPQNGDVALHLLEAVGVDTSNAVVCPLTAGGATFHDSRTLHFTAPNVTDRPRLAWPTEFQLAPVRRDVPLDHPWVTEWRAVTSQTAPKAYVGDGKFKPV